MKIQQWTGIYKSEVSEFINREQEVDTILEGLGKFRVLKIKKMENGNFLFIDGCDEYFNIELNVNQVEEFISELKQMVKEK